MTVRGAWMKRSVVVAVGAMALCATGLAASGCGDGASTETTGTATAGRVATVSPSDGDSYTVTLAEGQSAPVDIFRDSAEGKVFIYQPGSGTNVEETRGSLFAVALSEPAGAGYTWRATGGTAPGAVVRPVQEWVLTTSPDDGSPGTHYWVYRAAEAGTGTLTFGRFAPDDAKASDTATFRVRVTD